MTAGGAPKGARLACRARGPGCAAQDEARRVRYLRSMLGDYALLPDAEERIRRDEPDLHRFLERHPQYWKLLEEERADQLR